MRNVHFVYIYDSNNVSLRYYEYNLDIDEERFYLAMIIQPNDYDLYNTKIHLRGETSGFEMDLPLENVDLIDRVIEISNDLSDTGFVDGEDIDFTITLQMAQEVSFSWASEDKHQVDTTPSEPHLFLKNPYEITFSINDNVDGEFAESGTYVFNNGRLDEWAQEHIEYSSDHRSITISIYQIDGSIHIDLPLIIDTSINTFVLNTATFTFGTLKYIKIVKDEDTSTGESVKIYYKDENDEERMVTTNIPHANDKKIIGFALENNSDKVFVLYNEKTYCKIDSSITLHPILEDVTPVTPSVFEIIFYNNHAEINKVDKRNDLSIGTGIIGTLRDSCNVQSPSITIEMSAQTFYENGWNYVYIEMFKRYYFITSTTIIQKGLWQIDLKEDVLMSFKKDIWYQNGLIARQEYDYNDDVVDSERLVENQFITSKVDCGDNLFDISNSTGYKCVVGTAQWVENITFTTIPDYEEFSDYELMSEKPHGNQKYTTKFSTLYMGGLEDEENIQNAIIKGDFETSEIYNNPSEYVILNQHFPFRLYEWFYTSDNPGFVAVGSTDLKNTSGQTFRASFILAPKQRFYIFHIDRYFNNFMDFSPYTKIKMYIPYVDIIDLPVDLVMNKTLKVGYMIDVYSSKLFVNIAIIENDEEKLILTTSGDIGTNQPIGRTNATERNRNREIAKINRIAGVISGGISSIPQFKESIASPLVNMGKGIANTIMSTLTGAKIDAITNNQETYSGGTISGDVNGMFLPQRAFLLITRPKPIPIDDNYTNVKGKPLGEYRTLSALHGFTIVDDIHLSGFTTATDDEITEIENLLRTGVHL